MSRGAVVLVFVLACGSSAPPPPARPEPEPEPPPAAPPPDARADCAAIDEIFVSFKYPTSETPSEAELVRYYGNMTKAFREVRLVTPDLRAAAKDVSDLFGALSGKADAIARAYVALDAAQQARSKRLGDIHEGMRAIWNIRDYCESSECKKIFEIEKKHHAIVRMSTEDVAAFRNAIAAFRNDLGTVSANESSLAFARVNLDKALTGYEETSLKLVDAQTAFDDVARSKESKLLRGRILAYCPQLGERR